MAEAKKKSATPKQGKTELAVMDASLGKLEMLSKQLAKSGVVPMAYIGKPDNIFATIQLGRELGIPPMVALNNIASINGRPSLGTDLMIGIASKHPEWAGYEILTSTEEKAEVAVYRRNKLTGKVFTFVGEYTIEEAEAAGLVKPNSPWVKYRKRMLKHRASTFAVRDAFPDALAGSYGYEEMAPEKFAEVSETEYELLDDIAVSQIESKESVKVVPSKAKIAKIAK